MQSDGNSFCGYVVFDNFAKAFRDEENSLDQIYEKEIVRNIITMILILYSIKQKCIHTQQ